MEDEMRKKILAPLDQHRIMTVATLRPDGWPLATTVGYVNEGVSLYFLCGLDSQKAKNLARGVRLSLTIDHDATDLMAIIGLSTAARTGSAGPSRSGESLAHVAAETPGGTAFAHEDAASSDEARIFRVTPWVISVLDYAKCFGHTDLVICSWRRSNVS